MDLIILTIALPENTPFRSYECSGERKIASSLKSTKLVDVLCPQWGASFLQDFEEHIDGRNDKPH